MTGLPPGTTVRRPVLDDARAIYALAAKSNVTAIGVADITYDDVADELAEPGFDRERDGWLVHDVGGAVSGWAWAFNPGRVALVVVDVVASDEAVAGWLWDRVLGRAVEVLGEGGHDEGVIDTNLYRADEVGRRRVAARGFTPATTFHRMRIDHDAPPPPPAPALPLGVVVTVGPGDDAFQRRVHAVHQRSFVDHFGFQRQAFQSWREAHEASSSHDWVQVRLATVAGEPAAFLIGNDQFVLDEGCGYVHRVGVLPEFRGRGLARLLLRRAMAEDAARGRRGTILHVDTANPTPALDLYLGLGFRAVLVIDVWRRRLLENAP